jgi:hypothetical protein
MHEFTFDVELINHEEGNYYLDDYEDAKKVADWFKDQNSWRVGEELSSLSFEPVKSGNKYTMKCTYELIEDEASMKNWIIDPDDDGNHPIKLGDFEYLVMGF